MNTITTKQISLIAAIILIAAALGAYALHRSPEPSSLGGSLGDTPSPIIATSTTFSVTTGASVRLLATSTPTTRIAASIQAINCATGADLFLRTAGDLPAVAGQGMWVQSSTTRTFATYPEVPVVQGAVQGITSVGTCTVLVTEWVRRF